MQNLYLGVMSGTSMDGIDIALVDINDKHIIPLTSDCYSIPTSIKQQLLALCDNQLITLLQLGELDHKLGHLFADCINQFILHNKLDRTQIRAIGCHGQTIYHAPQADYPFTMQIGDANIINVKTGITTVADFRRKDMAYGGQGAPLVPAFHKAILFDESKNRVVVNIGGMSNISVLIPKQKIMGYDTGPGNILLDSWIQHQLGQPYDNNGQWAANGKINQSLLTQFLKEDYFQLIPPKSTGRETFNLSWLMNQLNQLLKPSNPNLQDIQMTLVELTAKTICDQINTLAINADLACQLLVCGGGAKNPLIMERLTHLLPNWQVFTTDQIGIKSDDMEAIAFAWLAYAKLHNIPSNIPDVTGASQTTSLGVIYS